MIFHSLARLGAAALALLLVASPLRAECQGQNLIDALPADRLAALEAAVADQPYARGNFWTAQKDGQTLYLVGTYHLDDPRHEPAARLVGRIIPKVSLLMVEAGPEEERKLTRAVAEAPELLFYTDGPSLMQRMPPEDWAALTAAMAARGLPGVMVAKFRPWYVSMLLGMPNCGKPAKPGKPDGLDARIMRRAEAADLPIMALEPHDTLFKLFDEMPEAEQLEMIRTALLMEGAANDISVTLADLYFQGEARRMWEFMRLEAATMPGYDAARADAEYARMEDLLMTRRNTAWIGVIEAAATAVAQGADGDVLLAFGALHLPGKAGVLNLLAERGWQIATLDPASLQP